MTRENTVKIITIVLIIKVFLVLFLLAFYLGWIEIGNKDLIAAAKEENSSEAVNGKEQKLLARKETKAEAGSFLENLLKVPDLDVSKSTKDEIGRYITLIEQAKQQLMERTKMLDTKVEQLKKLELKLDEKIRSLDEERKFFAKTIQNEKKIQEDRLTTLISLYEKMEPKKAAPVFEAMDKDLVVAIFQKLKTKQVTAVLELMNSDKSAEITEYFGRIGSAREYDLLKEMNTSLQTAFNDCKGMPK